MKRLRSPRMVLRMIGRSNRIIDRETRRVQELKNRYRELVDAAMLRDPEPWAHAPLREPPYKEVIGERIYSTNPKFEGDFVLDCFYSHDEPGWWLASELVMLHNAGLPL